MNAETPLADFEYRVGRLELHPGDVLVVKLSAPASPDMLARIGRKVKEFLPQAMKYIMIDGQIDLAVLTKSDLESRIEIAGEDDSDLKHQE